jgi:hypothetical protein
MLKKLSYLFLLTLLLGAVGCTKDHVVEPSSSMIERSSDNDGKEASNDDLITDDEDDEGDSERNRKTTEQ